MDSVIEFRRIFDTIPEKFDKYRVRYSQALFDTFIQEAGIAPGKCVLELGPGTGQATDPILNTGCDYHAIEIGDNFSCFLKEKYGKRQNFSLIHDDFITHDFGSMRFDAIYSAATIQWIPEEIAFNKTFALLKPGGILAMMFLRAEYKTTNEALYNRIQTVYDAYFKPQQQYDSRAFKYENALKYGYCDFQKHEYHAQRILTSDEYVNYCGTHSDHLTLVEPDKSKFFDGLRQAVLDFENRLVFNDTYILIMVRKRH